MVLKLRSHNINGFDSSHEFLAQECEENSFSVLAMQEHWLRPAYRKQKGINRLKSLHPNYDAFGTSGMVDQIDQQVLRGRPYGGTGFLFHKELTNSIRARIDLKHSRVTVLELSTQKENILLINVYFPFYDSSRISEQIITYRETVAFVSDIMMSNPSHKFILLADLNCNIFISSHPFSQSIRDMMSEFDLISSFEFSPEFDSANDFTRFDLKRKSFTLIDGILISRSLSTYVESCTILHPPNNVSDHLPIELILNVEFDKFSPTTTNTTSYIPWASLSQDDLILFRETMSAELSKIVIPFHALDHGAKLCNNCDCLLALETFYRDIISAVGKADQSLPRRRHGISKPFWSPELTALKQKSIDSHILWRDCGSPRSGPIFEEKMRSNYQYKTVLRRAKNKSNHELSSRMSSDLTSKDDNAFWKRWNQINGKAAAPSSMIDGYVDYDRISNAFSNTYSSVYKPSSSNDRLKDKFHNAFSAFESEHLDDFISPYLFSWSDMTDAVFSLKVGKATSTAMKAEHIFLGSPELTCYFHLLFNGLLTHSYLPYEFLNGTISPILKDSNGDITASSNYRPVALGPIISQLFEYALYNKFKSHLVSDDLQYGFKKSHSTAHAIFVLKSCIDYYTSHGSKVFVSFLDCSKAFDTISHYGIFIKLIERKVPLCFLKLVMYLYLNMKSCCSWRGTKSEFFDVSSGTKQGGVISPRIFAIYMDDLIARLRKRGIGCHYINLFIACILYADDLCLMAPSRGSMQELLNICEEYCKEFCLSFNVNKSKILLFGQFKGCQVADITLDGRVIEVVNEWKYLGVTITAGPKVSFSSKPPLNTFYCSVNSILSSIRKPNELVLMKLLFSNCVPCLTYASEVVEYKSTEMNNYNVAINDAIRRIFSFNRWESTRLLRQQLGYPNIYEIFNSRQKSFLAKNATSPNAMKLSGS